MMASGLESPPLSGVLAHDGELMNFFASDLATDWMAWSSDGSNSVNSVSEQSSSAPLALDGPTKLLLLSCYAKIFQAFRQIFAAVYSGLQSGENIAELLYDLRVEDVILDGDDDLKILVLMQVVTHKLNTLGVQLGVPEKHYISVGSGGLDAPKQIQSRGRQPSSEETEPTLDAILSGSETDSWDIAIDVER
ncbi:hypothetical protein K4K48_003871 [Colletotrichum sp. SAR 10_66]|nr:hypothetical protein K4K48_003871 [Colletotrichum sp. SAR 10_66]